MLPQNRKRALVLSGGGGRGAYHVGALRFLYEQEWVPDIVVGTSIGAVNGAALASGHTPHSLWSLWKRLHTENVQQPNLNPLRDIFLLNTSPLRETLQREGWMNFDRINSPEAAVHLRITATEIETGRLHIFGNSINKHGKNLRHEPITIDHIIASCSIPLVYPATQLNGRIYWDGATVSNTPLAAAIDAGAEEIVVVLMTPWAEEKDVELPTSLIQAAGLSLDWALLASFRSDLKMFQRVNELVRLSQQNRQLVLENQQLRMVIADLLQKVDYSDIPALADRDNDGIPDILEESLRVLPDPVIVAPPKPIPADQIISYTPEGHQRMYDLGYENAAQTWAEAGYQVEGGRPTDETSNF